jgi:3-ketosteroid 9alpha-monooxygenase subunit A
MINAHTLIDDHNLDLSFGVMLRASAHSRRFAAAYIADLQRGFAQDIAIWTHKQWRERPMLCAGDGPVMALRRWYAQFYP